MDDSLKSLCWWLSLSFIFCVVWAGVGLLTKWENAGIQQEVWRRQGIEMTQWEIYRGAKPALVVKE